MSDVKPVVTPYMTRIHELITEYRDATTAAKKQRARKAIIECVGARDAALQAEIDALRKDAERLNYLANDMQDMTFNGVDVLDFIEEDCDWPKAWRKALDTAIAKEKQP